MATVYPRSPRSALLGWAEVHAQKWAEDPQAVGLTPQSTAQYAALIAEAKQARQAQVEAQSAAMAATLRFNDLAADVERFTGAMVKTVRAFAAVAPRENMVLASAQLDPVRPDRGPSELTPAKPGMVSARLLTTGALELSWRCTQPRGTDGAVYILYRQLPGEAGYVQLAMTGRKRFVDATIPAGTVSVNYYVQARRGGAVGPVGDSTTISLGNPELATTLPRRAAA